MNRTTKMLPLLFALASGCDQYKDIPFAQCLGEAGLPLSNSAVKRDLTTGNWAYVSEVRDETGTNGEDYFFPAEDKILHRGDLGRMTPVYMRDSMQDRIMATAKTCYEKTAPKGP